MTAAGTTQPWWREAVIYQVYVRSFADGDGDGVGDLHGLVERLPYLSDHLGVDAIWLSPCYPSPLYDYGYDVSDYTSIDEALGGLEAFDRLVRACRSRGLRVVIDWVPNHTSDQHEWFRASRSSRNDHHRDWYYWRDPGPRGREPNNWLSELGRPMWTWDRATEQYYLHSFQPQMPDLNWRNPAVRQAMLDTLAWWFERGVDGVRVDVAHLLGKDPELRDNPPAPNMSENPYDIQHPRYTTQMHTRDRGHPDLFAWHREMRRVAEDHSRDGRRLLLLGELEAMPAAEWACYFGTDADGLHLPMSFHVIESTWSATSLAAVLDEVERATPPGSWPTVVIGNHDRPRAASRYGDERARTAAMLLLTVRGTPVMYYGDELGMTDAELSNEPRDPLGRDVVRVPMPWTSDGHHAFCADTVQPWLPFHPDSARRNVATMSEDATSILTLYRELLRLRRAHPALRAGSYRSLPTDGTCLVYERAHERDRLLVVLNTIGLSRAVDLPEPGVVALSTTLRGADREPLERVVLGPHEGIIFRVPPSPATAGGSADPGA